MLCSEDAVLFALAKKGYFSWGIFRKKVILNNLGVLFAWAHTGSAGGKGVCCQAGVGRKVNPLNLWDPEFLLHTQAGPFIHKTQLNFKKGNFPPFLP